MVRILRARGESRLNAVWERLGRTDGDDETPSEQYRRLRMAMLGGRAGRRCCDIRDHGNTDSEVLAEVMETLDVEESMIDRRAARAESSDGKTLITPAQTAGAVRGPGRGAGGRQRRTAPRAASTACARAPGGCTCGCA